MIDTIHIYLKWQSVINIKTSSIHNSLQIMKKAHQEHVWTLKHTVKSNKTNPTDSGSAKIITSGAEVCSNIIQGFFKTLKEFCKKIVEFWLLKKTQKYLFIIYTAKYRHRNKVAKKDHRDPLIARWKHY